MGVAGEFTGVWLSGRFPSEATFVREESFTRRWYHDEHDDFDQFKLCFGPTTFLAFALPTGSIASKTTLFTSAGCPYPPRAFHPAPDAERLYVVTVFARQG